MMTMDEKTFKKRLGVYGADFERWPPGEAGAARDLMASSPKVLAAYHEAQGLDRLLDQFAAPPLPAGLAVRAANEALLRRGAVEKKRAMPRGFRLGGAFGGGGMRAALAGVSVCLLLVFALPSQQESGDVGAFLASLDTIASRNQQQLAEADDVLGMLQVSDADDQGKSPTSDELMQTLFGDDNGQKL